MSGFLLRALEHVHGHSAWLSAIALAHPATLLRRARRRALLSAATATGLVTATAAFGLLLYPPYRAEVKPLLFASVPSVGLAFERKEHLAVGAVVFAWVGLVAHFADSRRAAPGRAPTAAFVAYAAAALLALAAALLGTAVAVHATF